MITPYTDAEGMLPQIKGKLTIQNKKSSCLLYNLVNSLPVPSISNIYQVKQILNVMHILFYHIIEAT